MTFVADNPAEARHDVPGHPESAARAHAIRTAFADDPLISRLPWLKPDRLLSREEALRVHSERLWFNLEAAERGGGAELLDPDTYVVPGSFEAARGTARLCMQAVERSLREDEAGFVIARPPGHHATPDRSMGFCLLNNVALAARHALNHGARRVLIFDHDVHHGNGTQEVFYESDEVLYESFHLSPHYPGTGSVEETGRGGGKGFTVNAPLRYGDGDEEVRSLLVNIFVPLAARFAPDLVVMSAGYDSLVGDPLGGLRLSSDFFGEIATRLRRLTPSVVAVLEGGYQHERVAAAALSTLVGLDAGVAVGGKLRAPAVEARLRMLFPDA